MFKKFNEYYNIINEGVYDKHIFKVIFLSGGTGSGKSFISKNTLEGLGLKVVNSDIAFTYLMDKANISLKLNTISKDDYVKAMAIRNRAKELTEKQFNLYIDGRLGLIIDGTGRDYDKVSESVSVLRSLGYDCYMLFVNTTLEVALARNAKRDRTVAPELAVEFWKQAHANIGKFQNLFGAKNFILVDNSGDADNRVFTAVHKEVKKLLSEPVENYIAKQWIKDQINLKQK